jgi:hypothetical protein
MKSDDQTLQIEITIAQAKGRKAGRSSSAAGPKVPDPPRIPRIARLMALAIKFQDMVDRGEVRDYADLARLGYVSRARITQIMNLLHLAPDIQEQLLSLVPNQVMGQPVAERHIRRVASAVEWCQQRRRWNAEG